MPKARAVAALVQSFLRHAVVCIGRQALQAHANAGDTRCSTRVQVEFYELGR